MPRRSTSRLRVTLPLGISFYTFQSMSYAIDVYRGDARALRNFVDFACFVSMFPQLVAGPIIRFSEVADQLANRSHTLAKFARGVAFFSRRHGQEGPARQPVRARSPTPSSTPGRPRVLQAWHGVVGYAFQIYFDFSGYSDMAIGLGLMLGFVFARNFDSPYRSQSITEFWRRWHISLSTWLRDYLYVPLGGNRKGVRRTYINLGLTMLLGGLWHGASWNFVLWGAFHGALLAIERAVGVDRLYGWMPRALRVATTFSLVLVSWVFFRAADLPAALAYLGRMFGLGASADAAALLSGLLLSPYLALSFAVAAIVVWGGQQSWTWTRELTPLKIAIALGLLVVGHRRALDAGLQSVHLLHLLMSQPGPHLSREAEAVAEMAATRISRGGSFALTLALLAALPVGAVLEAARARRGEPTAFAGEAPIPTPGGLLATLQSEGSAGRQSRAAPEPRGARGPARARVGAVGRVAAGGPDGARARAGLWQQPGRRRPPGLALLPHRVRLPHRPPLPRAARARAPPHPRRPLFHVAEPDPVPGLVRLA